jgi:3-hydroxybutyrate dehydrogenase
MTMTDASTLAGQHAVVTGAGSGIGAAIAHALAGQGVRVTLMGRTLASLQAQAVPNAHCVVVDVSDERSVQAGFAAAAEVHGAADVLINNAGQVESQPFGRTSLELWNRMLQVNLTGGFLCTQQVLPGMLARGSGRIVNVASTAALKGYAYVAAYCAAKHGVLGWTRALALEVAQRGITVNAVCPGYTETELIERAVQQISAKTGRSAEQAKQQLAAANPQGRLVQPHEVAQAVLWLCQPASAAINGQAIALAGGEVM